MKHPIGTTDTDIQQHNLRVYNVVRYQLYKFPADDVLLLCPIKGSIDWSCLTSALITPEGYRSYKHGYQSGPNSRPGGTQRNALNRRAIGMSVLLPEIGCMSERCIENLHKQTNYCYMSCHLPVKIKVYYN